MRQAKQIVRVNRKGSRMFSGVPVTRIVSSIIRAPLQDYLFEPFFNLRTFFLIYEIGDAYVDACLTQAIGEHWLDTTYEEYRLNII